jgi:ABC-type Fe3+ transport system permease subunit
MNSTTPDDSGQGPTVWQNGNDTSGVSVWEDGDSYTYVDWTRIVLLILWLLGLTILLALLLIVILEHRRRPPVTNTTTAHDDVENQDKEQISGPPRHSWYRNAIVIPILAAAIAFSLSVVPHTSCEFLSLDLSDGNELLSIGLWSVAYDTNGDFGGQGICYSSYRTGEFPVDTALRVARVSAILACIVGGIALLVLLHYILSGRTCLIRRLTGPFWMAAFVQGLTLVIHLTDQCMANPSSCEPDRGFAFCITAIFFWVLSALGVSLVPLKGNRSTENQQTS